MAPKRGSKRATSAVSPAKASPAKARKVELPCEKYGCTKSEFEAVAEAVRLAEHLGEDCRAMLLATLPYSVCVPSDERSEQQTMVVDMLDEVVKAVVAKLEAAVAEAAVGIAAIDESRSEQTQLVEKSEAAASASTAAVDAAKVTLVEKTGDVAEANRALSAKQEEEKTGSVRSAAAEKEKQVLESCLATEYKALKEGTWEKPAESKKLYTTVGKVLKQLELEESMVAALPGALLKKAADRGSFDNMLLDQFESKLQGKIAELAAEIAGAAPAMAERAGAVEAAQGQLAAANAALETAAAELTSAQDALKTAMMDLKVAKDELAKTEPSKQEAVTAHDAKKAELDNFTYFTVETFSTLKSRVAKKDEPEPVAEEPKADAAPEAAPPAEVAA